MPKEPCLIEGCPKVNASRGLCGTHYSMIWSLIKLNVISLKDLALGGFLLDSQKARKPHRELLVSRSGYMLDGVLTISKVDE